MSFISLQFALFVAICLVVFYVCPKRFRWVVLLVASYVFYAICSLKVIGYIIITTATTYLAGRMIENIAVYQRSYIKEHSELTREQKKEFKSKCKNKQRIFLWSCIAINIGMPLGVSFYTFQSVGYLSDVFNSKIKAEKNFFKHALFVGFFPQIIQGPISRYNELADSLFSCADFNFYNIKSGFVRIMWGLFKKLVIADRLSAFVKGVMDLREYGFEGYYIILAVFFYSMQIYGDFSGGIDVTIGVAEMFSVKLTENFERPFFSKSISEYWRRWHITLGTWFKDYIFYPLSLFKPFLNLGKWVKTHISEGLGKRIPLYLPLIIVWTTTGMWHGSESRYVVWGLLNLFFVILGTEFEGISNKLIEKFKINVNGFLFKSYRVIKTFCLMSCLRLFDINKNTERAIEAFKHCSAL